MKKQKKPIRAKWPRVLRVSSHGAERFMVDSRRTGFAQGGRTFYESEAEALATAERFEQIMTNEGARGFAVLTPEQRADAAEAIAILAETGHESMSLVDAVRRTIGELEAERKRAIGPTVKEAMAAYLEAKRAEKERGELSALSLIELRSKGGKIRDYFAEKRLSQIDRPMVDNFLAQLDLKPRGKFNVLVKLNQFLNWSIWQNWITTNPASEAHVKVPENEVEILSAKKAEALLRSAEGSETVLPYLIVCLFGGLRPGEAAQLRWEFIHFGTEQIEVRKETSKTRETRFVEINPTLAEWLRPLRQKDGPIIGVNFKNDWKAIRRANGLREKDILRHTYGSYWLPIHKDRAHLAELMGNSIQIIKKHYRRAIPKQVAEQYWKIRPKTKAPKPVSEGKVIDFPGQSSELAV